MSNNKKGFSCSGCLIFLFSLVFIVSISMIFVNLTGKKDIIDILKEVDYDKYINNTEDTTTDTSDNPEGSIIPLIKTESIEYLFYYEQLNEVEKIMYEEMLRAIEGGKSSCTFENVDYQEYMDSAKRALYAVTYDHPLYFWVTNGYSSSYIDRKGNDNDTYTFKFRYYSYWDYTASPEKYIGDLTNEVKKVADLARAYSEPFERALFVHDYLITNTEYDKETLAETKKTIHDASCELIYSAYGCLVNKKTVCSGYAEAFQLIMNELGIKSTVVIGDANGPHQWNLIILDGEEYYIDITWDDKDRKDENGNFKYPNDSEYEYMCITTEELEKTHKAGDMFDIPLCDSETYNYFEYRGYQLELYDFEAVKAIVSVQGETKRIISVRFDTEAEFNKAKKTLIDDKKAFDIPVLEDGYSYIADEKHLTLKFFIN